MTKSYTVNDKAGLHVHKCASLVKCANSFDSDINIIFKDHKIDLKSILGLLSLCLSNHDEFAIEVNGKDAKEALESLEVLLK